jgi:ABC-type antimicrobial peptide transport system permease subunit
MLGAAAGIALLLGVIGVYGVVAYTVSLRAREIGLRLALGASPGMVGAMMVRQGMRLVAVGIGVGLGLTILITGFLRTLLFGVSRNDPVTLIAVALVLGGATLVATWIPARRAGRLDPALTLVGE